MRYLVALAAPFLALASVGGDGGSRGWMITGSQISNLRDAVHVKLVRLSADDEAEILRGQIGSLHLSALYVPPCNDESHCTVYRALHNEPEAHSLELNRNDFEELWAFAVGKILRFVREIRQAVALNDVRAQEIAYRQIEEYFGELANKERVEAAKRFIGLQLADLHVTDTRFLAYLATYREFVQESARVAIRNRAASDRLVKGNIYYHGLVAGERNGCPPIDLATRKTLVVDGKAYQSLWVGRTLVVIPQLDSVPTGYVDPYKIGATEFLKPKSQKDFAFPGKFAWEPLVPQAGRNMSRIGG